MGNFTADGTILKNGICHIQSAFSEFDKFLFEKDVLNANNIGLCSERKPFHYLF